MKTKFGLSFDIVDLERISELRRLRGFSVNPWTTGSRFIISHRLLTDEVYASGLRDVLGEFRAKALFILDEAHHAAPSAGTRYAVSSQFTKAVREIAERFEHRLFLGRPHFAQIWATPIAFLLYWRYSIHSVLRAASRCDQKTWNPLWFAG